MSRAIEDFLLNKKEPLATKVKKQFSALGEGVESLLATRYVRGGVKEGLAFSLAFMAAATGGLLVAGGALTLSDNIAQQTFGDGPLHKSYEPVMADYLVKARSLNALSLYNNDRKYIPTQEAANTIASIAGVSQLNINGMSDAALKGLLKTSIAKVSNDAFADTRLSEKDLARLHIESGLKMEYNYSGAYMRNECAQKGLTDVQGCLKDRSMVAPSGFELLMAIGVLSLGLLAGIGAYKVTYKGVEDSLDAKLPGHPDRPRQAKFDFG